MGTWEPHTARAQFDLAANAFTSVVAKISPDQWDQRGLGEWSVRDLVGHGSRAFMTIESYLAASNGEPRAPDLPDVSAYYREIKSSHWERAAIARRGRDAGVALGADPATAVAAIAARVRGLVRASPDQVTLMTPAGTIRLVDYLWTRMYELTVHTLDVIRATGIDRPSVLAEPVRTALTLSARIAADVPTAADLLLLLTGREGVPQGLNPI